jgi:flagellar protein FliS
VFGQNKSGVNMYAHMSVETGVLAASPNKLTIMLYDGAITACYSAIRHMQLSDIPNKGAMLSHAILIIESGLRLSLNKKAGGQIAESLDALYAYMSNRLVTANIRNQPELVQEVIKLLTELKGAWEAIGNQQSASQATSPVISMVQPNQGVVAASRNIANYAKV